MKYVYVLVSTSDDFYYEQFLMSVFSLALHTKNADIYVLTDNRTESTFTEQNKRLALKNLDVHILSVPFEDSVTNLKRSRILKTTIPNYVSGDFLFIDCDTIICEDLSNVAEILSDNEMKIGAVLDGHVFLDEHKHKDYFIKREKKLGFSATKTTGKHFNSGVILFRDCNESRLFFKKWNQLLTWCSTEKNENHDQPAFNEASLECGNILKELPGELNCQISQGGLFYLSKAKIIHYFSSEGGKNYISYYKLADKSLLSRIKESGYIPDDIKQMIAEPKFQFNKVHLINDQRIVNIMQSPLMFTLADINAKLPRFFNFLEAQAAFIRKIGKKLKGKK